jgi:uncharacterized protein
MKIEWDEKKRESNLAKHNVDFLDVHELFESPFFCREDRRKDYGEQRCVAIGHVQGRLMVAAYTVRNDVVRIISLRKGNSREQKRFETTIHDRLEAH